MTDCAENKYFFLSNFCCIITLISSIIDHYGTVKNFKKSGKIKSKFLMMKILRTGSQGSNYSGSYRKKYCCLKINFPVYCRGGSRTVATSKTERFVIIANGWKPLTIITKRSILDVAAFLDPPLHRLLLCVPIKIKYLMMKLITNVAWKTYNNIARQRIGERLNYLQWILLNWIIQNSDYFKGKEK